MTRKEWTDQWVIQFMASRTAIVYDIHQSRGDFDRLTNPVDIIEEAVYLAEKQYDSLQKYKEENKIGGYIT